MAFPLPFLSIPSENGDYQLFGPVQNTSIPIDRDIYEVSKEETEKIKNKSNMTQLSQTIHTFLENNKEDSYHLTKYTTFQIDEVQAEIYVFCDYHDDPYSYYYKFFSKNVEYNSDDMIEKDVLIYESKSFTNIYALLENIKKVENTYKLLDYYLLSPEKMIEARAQRGFIPLHIDKVCSVCYELTLEYTTCKHAICLKCRDKCIVQGKKTCPICRGSDLSIYPNTL